VHPDCGPPLERTVLTASDYGRGKGIQGILFLEGQMNILIAGSTGNLGRALVRVGLERGHQVVGLARHPEKLAEFEGHGGFRSLHAEATRRGELRGAFAGVEVVISALGITRQRDGLRFRDVDYQGNLNILEEAGRAGSGRFVYTSGYGIDEFPDNPMYRAKKEFELALRASGMPYLIVRPTGFFSDMMMILQMAQRGRVYLLGSGAGKVNPIDLRDLAELYYDHLGDAGAILEVGGPKSYTFQEIARMALATAGKPERIVHVPPTLIALVLPLVRLFSFNTFAELQAFSRIMTHGAEAPPHGSRSLDEAFREAVSQKADS
jgi:uncharacterized protein YbjT (DUF2867 family)